MKEKTLQEVWYDMHDIKELLDDYVIDGELSCENTDLWNHLDIALEDMTFLMDKLNEKNK